MAGKVDGWVIVFASARELDSVVSDDQAGGMWFVDIQGKLLTSANANGWVWF